MFTWVLRRYVTFTLVSTQTFRRALTAWADKGTEIIRAPSVEEGTGKLYTCPRWIWMMYLWWSVCILYLTELAVADSGLCFFVRVTPFYSYPFV